MPDSSYSHYEHLLKFPKEFFSLSSPGKATKDGILANPNVTGISIRYNWLDLEPTEGITIGPGSIPRWQEQPPRASKLCCES
jgi:hypothetical protein